MRRSDLVVTILIAAATSASTAVIVSSRDVAADGNAQTDGVPRVIPYQGVLEFDGAPVSGTYAMRFTVYDGAAVVWTETQNVAVYAGTFSVMLGTVAGGVDALARRADDLTLQITLLNEDGDEDDVVLAGAQRFVPVPYALWSAAASDMTVARDASIGRNIDVIGTSRLRGNATLDGTLTSSGRGTFNNGVTVSAGGLTVAAGGATITGNTTIASGNLSVSGLATVNTLQSNGNISLGTGQSSGSLSFVNSGESAINFPTNPFGGSGDQARIRNFRSGATGETSILRIENGNDADDTIELHAAGATRLTVGASVNVSAPMTFNGRDEAWVFVGNSGSRWGNYYEHVCPTNQFVCGIALHDEGSQGGGDDSGVNDIWIRCCTLGR